MLEGYDGFPKMTEAAPPPDAWPIPKDVYWNADASNFVSFPLNKGMGNEFYATWRHRIAEFPTGPHAANWCTHYRAFGNDTCGVGIPYEKWQSTPFLQRPCFLTEKGESKPGAVECARLRRPTATEQDMAQRAFHASTTRVLAAIAATAE